MANLDLKFYWAVFLRRLPYFALAAALVSAIGLTVAIILPPVYISQARLLVEPQQISDELAQSTVSIDPFEQIQIIQQRVMTRANLLKLARASGVGEDSPEPLSTEDLVQIMARRITFTGSEPEEVGRFGPSPGATVIGISVEGPTAGEAAQGASELVQLILEEIQRIRTGRATGTMNFFEAEVERLAEALAAKATQIAEFKTLNVESLPDSLDSRRQQQLIEQERLLALEREETALRNERATTIWVFERTGQGTLNTQTPEEMQLEAVKSERLQKLAIYSPTSPTIRVLNNQIASLEKLVEEQRTARALPGEDGQPAQPSTALDLELAPIDGRLDFIAQEKQMIESTLTELQGSIAQTPSNEMTLDTLERDLETLRREHETASARLAQAQVGERIELSSRGERFSLIEEPVEPSGPDSPNRKLIAVAGAVGGIGAGLGLVLLLEMLNRSIRRSVDLSSQLGIQPMATIPYIRTAREQRWKRFLLAAFFVLIFVVIPGGLFLIHTYYMPLDLVIDNIKDSLMGDPSAAPQAPPEPPVDPDAPAEMPES